MTSNSTLRLRGPSLMMDGLGPGGKGKGVPHVIEPSVGLDRLMLAVLADGYIIERSKGGERVVLRLATDVAPVRAESATQINHAEQVEVATQLQANLSVRSLIQASLL